MPTDAGSIYSEVRIKLANLEADIRTVNSKIDRMYNNTKDKAGGFGSFWKNAFQTAFGFGIVQIVQRVTAAIKDMIGIFSGYQQSMKNVQSVTGAVGEDFRQLQEAAKNAGETTRFTARQAADALYYLGSAGFSARQSIEALDGVLQLAGATQSDLASTAESVASIISQYNLEANEAGRVSNVFAAAIGNSQATMEKLTNSFRQVGSVAAGFGYTLEETTGILQELYNAGYRGQMAGRALKSAMADLASPTANIRNIMAKYNVELSKVNPETNKFADIIDTLGEAGLSTADIIDAFGKVAGPQIATLVNQGGEALRRYTDDVTGTNAAAEAYRIQNDSLAGSIDFLKSKLESTAIAIFEKLEPGMRDLIDSFIKFLDAIKPVGLFLGTILNVILKLASVSTNALTNLFKTLLFSFKEVNPPMKEAADKLTKVTDAIKKAGELGNTSKKLNELTDEYDKLKSKTNLTKGEQDRLQSVIMQIEKIMPGAVTKFDEYGNAIEISGEKSREAAKQMLIAREAVLQNALTQLKASEAIYKRVVRNNEADAKASKENRNRLISESALADTRLALLDEFITKYKQSTKGVEDFIGPFAIAGAKGAAFNEILKKMNPQLQQAGLDFNNLAIQIDSGEDPLLILEKEMRKANKTVNDLQKSLENPPKAEQAYIDAKAKLDEIAELEKELTILQKNLGDIKKVDPAEKGAPDKMETLTQISQEFWNNYNMEIKNAIRESETFGGKQDALKAKLDFLKSAYLDLIAQGLDPAGATLTKLKQEYDLTAIELQALIDTEREHEEQLKKNEEIQENIANLTADYYQKTYELGKSESELIDIEREKAIETVKAMGASEEATKQAIDAINVYYDKLKKNSEEVRDDFKITTEYILQESANLANALGQVFTAIADQRIEELDRQMQAELDAAGLSEETEREKLERELKDAKKTGNKEKQQELENSLARLAIEEEYEKKKAEVNYQAELSAWRLKLAAILTDTAAGIAAALRIPWPANLVPIGFATVQGGIQYATASAQKPQKPVFESGGIFLDHTAGTEGADVKLHSPEMILNEGQMKNLFNMINSGNTAGTERETNLTVIIQQDSIEMARATAKVFNDGIVTLNPERAIQ